MHAYRRFVQETMDQKRMRAADVERNGGPSRQVISKLLTDSRDALDRRPDQATVEAFARGLDVRPEAVLAAVAEAMGLPVQVSVAGLDLASDEQLLAEVRRRMGMRHDDHDQQDHEHHEQPPARERSTAAERRGAAGGDAGAGEKTAVPAVAPAPEDAGVRPEDLDLAAHPYMELSRDRQDAAWGDVGEENQDHDIEGGA